mgnify:CR=1 FL=1
MADKDPKKPAGGPVEGVKGAAKKILTAAESAAATYAAAQAGIGEAVLAKAGIDQFAQALSATEGPLKFFGESIKFTAEESEKLSKGLIAAASSTENIFGLSLTRVRDEMDKLALSSMQWGKSISENNKMMADFVATTNTKLIPAFGKTLIPLTKSISLFEGLGVATQTSIGIIDTLRGTLGQTAEQTILTRRELSTFASVTGQSVASVASDYQKNIGAFMDMLDPRRMNQAFMTFQAQAKRMNMEANQLYGIAQKFDTIDSANEIGGRLNQTFSSLGIEFNALALQDMSMEQRTGYISQKVNEALKKARRDFTNQEARLLTRSLAQSLGVDVRTIRGLGAEGAGGGRLTAFEKGARRGEGMTLMSEQAEKDLARQMTLIENQQKAALEFAKQQMAQQARDVLMKTEEFKKLGALLDPRKAYVEFAERITGTLFTPERVQHMSDGLSTAMTTAIDKWAKTPIAQKEFNQLLKTANEVGAVAYADKLTELNNAGKLNIGTVTSMGFGGLSLRTTVADSG